MVKKKIKEIKLPVEFNPGLMQYEVKLPVKKRKTRKNNNS